MSDSTYRPFLPDKRFCKRFYLKAFLVASVAIVIAFYGLKIAQQFAFQSQEIIYDLKNDSVLVGSERDPIIARKSAMTETERELYQFYSDYSLNELIGMGFSDRIDDASFWRSCSLLATMLLVFQGYRRLPHFVKKYLEQIEFLNLRQTIWVVLMVAVYVTLYILHIHEDHGDTYGTFFCSRKVDVVWQIQWMEGVLNIVMIVATCLPVFFVYRCVVAACDALGSEKETMMGVSEFLRAAYLPLLIFLVGYGVVLVAYKVGLPGSGQKLLAVPRKLLHRQIEAVIWFAPYAFPIFLRIWFSLPRGYGIGFTGKWFLPDLQKTKSE